MGSWRRNLKPRRLPRSRYQTRRSVPLMLFRSSRARSVSGECTASTFTPRVRGNQSWLLTRTPPHPAVPCGQRRPPPQGAEVKALVRRTAPPGGALRAAPTSPARRGGESSDYGFAFSSFIALSRLRSRVSGVLPLAIGAVSRYLPLYERLSKYFFAFASLASAFASSGGTSTSRA